MTEPAAAYSPRFSYTTAMVRALLEFEGACRTVDRLPLPPDTSFVMRAHAMRRSTIGSVSIEGNDTPPSRVFPVLVAADRGDDRQQEVRNYWRALEWIEQKAEARTDVGEEFIQRLHRIIIVRGRGRRGDRSPYRTSMVHVTDASTGRIEYSPPEPGDVPGLMAALVAWLRGQAAAGLPAAVRAGILAHRLVSIHPFEDGNGRTTRATATAQLWRDGYGMRGFLSLEEHLALDRAAYYNALQMDLHDNYYFGRHDADLTQWLEYFVLALARAASEVCERAQKLASAADIEPPRGPWEGLPRLEQQVLARAMLVSLSTGAGAELTSAAVQDWFGVSPKTARDWLAKWCASGLVEPSRGDQRVRAYRLRGAWREFVDESVAEATRLE